MGDTGGNAQRLELNEDVPANDTTDTAIAEWNPTYLTPERQSVLAVVNPCYGVFDVKAKDVSDGKSSTDPAYDTAGVKKEQENGQSDPGYESIVAVKERDKTVDSEKNKMNEGNSQADTNGENIDFKIAGAEKRNTKKEKTEDPNQDSKPDKKKEASDIKNEEVDDTNSYNKTGYKNPDVRKDGIDDASSETAYSKPVKERKTGDAKNDESIIPDSYEEPGYETLVAGKEENDGRNSDTTYAKPDEKGSTDNTGHTKIAKSIDPGCYEEPGYEASDLTKRENDTISDTTYAKPDKKRSADDTKSGKSVGADSYKEPGYEILDATKKEIEGTSSDTTYAKPYKKTSAGNIKIGECIDPDFLDSYDTVEVKKVEKVGTSSNTIYAKPDKKRSADKMKTGKIMDTSSYEEPGYETPNFTKKEVQSTTSETTYAKPDKKRKEAGRQDHLASDNGLKTDKENAGHSSPDIKRIEIKGDLYTLPDKSKNSEKVRIESLKRLMFTPNGLPQAGTLVIKCVAQYLIRPFSFPMDRAISMSDRKIINRQRQTFLVKRRVEKS